ncbi:MAG TPA: M14 family zinc carboxypeptidase [Jatrophihabitans sp.]|jgi:protein MpaA|nr:M14 family zinc carboxypeptidase [Jatrophihabitans sp.]
MIPARTRTTAAHGMTTRARLAIVLAATTVASGFVMLVAATPARAAQLPTAVIRTKLLGHSVQGRPIRAYELGNPYSHTKAVILGEMHGDEPAGVTLVRSIIRAHYTVTGLDLWVIPTMNPDGYAQHTRKNAHHVDLNRNWPHNWAHLTGMYYSGPRPLSEPETRAMYGFLKWLRPRYLVSLHQPLHGVDTTDGGAKFPGFRHRLAHNLGLPEKAFRCWSVCHGSMTGWFTRHLPGAAITVEFGWSPTDSYLTGRAARGIIKAMRGGFAKLSTRNPIGHLDAAYAHGSTVHVRGWALDRDKRGVRLHVALYADGHRIRHHRTWIKRAGINDRYGASGAHGYAWSFPARNGSHRYCVGYTNVGAGTGNTRTCRTLTVNGSPRGKLENADSPASATVRMTGWAFDPDRTSRSIDVRVFGDGSRVGDYPADGARPDVDSTYRITGKHGFAITLTGVAGGDHKYCVTALNIGSARAPNTSLGCATVTVPS